MVYDIHYLGIYINDVQSIHVHTVISSEYLERLQVDLLHCQPAIFCEELHMRENKVMIRKQRIL